MARLFLILFLPLALAFQAVGQEDQKLERRVTNLAHELRCLVCQNQTLADSNAPLAVDLRNQIREQLQAGKSEREITDFMVQRYGDFVLYRPPFKASTVALWAGPFLLLALGAWLFLRRVRQKKPSEASLTEADRRRAAKLLE